MFKAGELSPSQSIYAGDFRPQEELYDLRSDPGEVHNVAEYPFYKKTLSRMRGLLENWMQETNDLGRFPESEEQLEALIERWGEERCVNPEYQTVLE